MINSLFNDYLLKRSIYIYFLLTFLVPPLYAQNNTSQILDQLQASEQAGEKPDVVICQTTQFLFSITSSYKSKSYSSPLILTFPPPEPFSLSLNYHWQKNLTASTSPYSLHYRYEIPIAGTGASLMAAALIAKTHELPLKEQQILLLKKSNITPIDRRATSYYSSTAQKASDFLLYTSTALPLVYLTSEKTRNDFIHIFVMQAETALLTYGITSLTKSLVYRPRPFTYNTSLPIESKLTRFGRESFFSGHVSSTAAMTFFTAATFTHYYPESTLKPLVWTYAIAWPAATGYFRYRAGKHFPTDIITGYLVGATIGWLIPRIHQKLRRTGKGKRDMLKDFSYNYSR